MKQEFEMTDLGLMHYFLGVEVQQTSEGIFISQAKYVADLLQKFNMVACKALATPIALGEKLTKEDASPKVDTTRYRIGSLMYLTTTRPDIMYVVSVISRFMRDPQVTLVGCFGFVSWSSKKQATVALSSAEAEYMAASSASSQATKSKYKYTERRRDTPPA
ncbi:uncharacterized mitochondrial protein AtMg00810-like [Cryptomeria japonica]|uniref:uncharacterized mitochondrial protein AtMg00810-like n=1 Tax=Cryptomeria japonica TaxID=3369 RepID=UPI0025AC4341|nr:uncharacterized mitochondrial protein AtMg00810-like [Cryptomeria japonica]